MQIIRFLKHFFICILCIGCLCTNSFAESNMPLGDIGEYGNWITKENMGTVNNNMSNDIISFENKFNTKIHSADFVPIEVRIGLMFMKALSSIDSVLQISLVRFAIIFLLFMYAFWVGLEAYKLIKESGDYKKLFYDIVKKGITISIWIIILNYGPAKIFTMIITPIIAVGTSLSDFILSAVAETYNVEIPNTCATIHNYVNSNASSSMLINADAAANIMCLPSRISMFFYNALGVGFNWMVSGFGHSATSVVLGIVSIYIFFKCILKYAFMTLGIVANLFLTLLMLPFTALAESMPATKEDNYAGQIFSGFLKVFHTKKFSEVLSVFINAAIYFVSLAIIIAICAALLSYTVKTTNSNTYVLANAMTNILCGCLVLYLAGRAEELATKVGGSIDNSFGKKLQEDTKTLWSNTKKIAGKLAKAWLKG